MTSSPAPWWQPHIHADRRPFLRARAALMRAVRAYFDGQDFIETETCALQVSPGNETHLHAFATTLTRPDGSTQPLYLNTSPEFACKKLLAAGEPRLYTLAPAYRNRERTRLHSPAFTMLEWYRAGQDYTVLMEDCAALLALAAKTTGATRLSWRGASIDPFATPERLTLTQAFARHAGIDLVASLRADGANDRDVLARQAVEKGVRVSADDSWSDLFSKILSQFVEPHLGMERATILMEYPVSEAALARPCPADPRFAERFEFYACGVELANAFGELNDPAEQRRRFTAEMAAKQRIYGEQYPIDEDFLAALAIMPAASGSAMGFERLVMLASGANHIDQVIWTPLAQ